MEITGSRRTPVKTLTPEQKQIDQQARLTISLELGHERPQIVAVYCGT